MHYLEKDRLQDRVLYHLQSAFENSGEVAQESFRLAMNGLELLKEDYEPEVTAESVLQDLSDISQGVIRDNETGEPVDFEEYQEIIYLKVEQLASVLGIKLGV